MKLTRQLKEYLQGFEFDNLFEVANTIQDYIEKKHEDYRTIPSETYDLAERYIKENRIYLEWESWTYKFLSKEDLFAELDVFSFVNREEVWMAVFDFYNDENTSPSWWELAEYDELAEEYIESRKLVFEE